MKRNEKQREKHCQSERKRENERQILKRHKYKINGKRDVDAAREQRSHSEGRSIPKNIFRWSIQ